MTLIMVGAGFRAAVASMACIVLQIVQEAEKRKMMAERKDYYKILGVAQSADQRDIKQVAAGYLCRSSSRCMRILPDLRDTTA